jgi:competence ComEA-like helix-hairpin-helix protein
MKKEYHLTITRKDRVYLTAFVLFLLGWELIKPLLPVFSKNDFYKTNAIADLTPLAVNHDTVQQREYYKKKDFSFQKREWGQPHFEKSNGELIAAPTSMQIMEASVLQLRSIGFSSKTAHIIRKYIDAGGVIYDEAGLMKIFSMDSAQLKAARPYLLYPEKSQKPMAQKTSFEKKPAFNIGIIDLNETNVDQLDILPGIGPVLAERIIKYRNSLGGFVRKEQLLECYGITPEVFEKIKDNLTISHSPDYIYINEIEVDSFFHPYLDKRMLRMISSYIKNHGRIASINDLRKVYPPDPTWCDRLIPYLKFE